MAKDKGKKAEAPKTEAPAAEATEASKKGLAVAQEAAAKKRDEQLGKALYPTGKTAREGSVFRWLQDCLISNGGSMSWKDLRDNMLKNYKPKTSQTFGEAYCQAYVRGGCQEGYLTDDEKVGVKTLTPAPEKPKKEVKPTEVGQLLLNQMKTFIPSDVHIRGEASISVSDLSDGLKEKVKSPKAIVKALEGLITGNFVFKTGEGDDLRYGLTKEGWAIGVEAQEV
jgi:hypothetical protein